MTTSAPCAMRVPTGLIRRTNVESMTLPMLVAAADSPARPVSEWAALRIERLMVNEEMQRGAVLAAAGIDDSCQYVGVLDPEQVDPTVVGLIRTRPGTVMDGTHWRDGGWRPLTPEVDPIGMPTIAIDDAATLADVLTALNENAAMLLRPTSPRAWMSGPQVVVASGTDGVPSDAAVFAVVDDADSNAVLALGYVQGGRVMSRVDGEWKPDDNLGFSLRGADPPQVTMLDPDQVPSLVRQIDDYDLAHSSSAATVAAAWDESKYNRVSGKFAPKGASDNTAPAPSARESAIRDYIANGGPPPSGVNPAAVKTAGSSASPADKAEMARRAQVRLRLQRKREAEMARRVNRERALRENYQQRLADGEDPRTLRANYKTEAIEELRRRQQYTEDTAIAREREKTKQLQYQLAKARQSSVTAAGGTGIPTTRMPNHLREYWVHGKGAARIRWGTSHDFYRCRRALRKYLNPAQIDGACATLHKLAVGTWPGKGHKHVTAAGTPLDAIRGGVMVALYPPDDVAQQVTVADGDPAEQLHVTLAYMGDVDDLDEREIAQILRAAQQVARDHPPVQGQLTGIGRFATEGDEPEPIYLPVDAPGLPELRQQLVDWLDIGGVQPRTDHGFTPHMTLAYRPRGTDGPEPDTSAPIPVTFPDVVVCVGDEQFRYPLSGDGA